MERKPYILAQTNWKTVKELDIELAVLPWGATEAHNFHLPYGTDIFEAGAIAEESARIAWNRGARPVVLPVVPFGVNTGQMNIPGTINMNPSTQAAVIHDITESLAKQGIKKLLILNGHGGNDFKQILREEGSKHPELFLASCNWFQSIEKRGILTNDGDHADEAETSLMLYLEPELVLPLREAGDGSHKKFSVDELNEPWAWAERQWTSVTADTGIGDPSQASREKGERYFEAITSKIGNLVYNLSKMDEIYT
ncbi:MAG TPA: creatininase family protein [Bacteroidales bacterium]|nr:creatininase family protein [Bacteroidales bacterium]